MYALIAFLPYYVGYTYVFGQALYFGISMAELSLGQFEYYVASISAFKAIIDGAAGIISPYLVSAFAITVLVVLVLLVLRLPEAPARAMASALGRSSVRRGLRRAGRVRSLVQLLLVAAILFFSTPYIRQLGEMSARRLTQSQFGGFYQLEQPTCNGPASCEMSTVLDYSRDTLLYANASEYFILRRMDGGRAVLVRLQKDTAPVTVDSLFRTRILGAF